MLPSILIGAAVLLAVVLAVRSVVKNRQHCSGDCAACGSNCGNPGSADTLKKEMIGKIKDLEDQK